MVRKVLIVEPEKDCRNRLAGILDRAGLETYPAETGAEVVSAVRTIPFDLALLDLILPDVSALDLIGYMLSVNRRLRPVVMVETKSKEMRMQVMNNGGFAVIRKPFTDDLVVVTVKTILRKIFPHTQQGS